MDFAVLTVTRSSRNFSCSCLHFAGSSATSRSSPTLQYAVRYVWYSVGYVHSHSAHSARHLEPALKTLLRSHSFHENVITASGVRTSSPVQVRHQGKAGCHNQLSDRFLAPQNSRSSTGFMTPGEASPITSTQLGGLASRRYFLMHIPMKHTPALGHSASFLDSVCVCASHNTPLPQLPPLFFPPCQGIKFGPVSYTPTFHVSWLRPLGTGVLYCYASSKWSLAQSPFSCSTLYLSWRVGNLNMDTLSVISVEHDIQKYFCRTGRQHSPLSDLLADSKMLRLSQPGWALGREASHQHQSDGPPKSLLRPCGPFWTRGVA